MRPGSSESVSPVHSYIAIALVSGAVLLYEVAVTRVLSVVLWYHFAFLSLSIAMLGLGAPGVWYALRKPHARSLHRCLLGAAVALPAGVIAIVKLRPQIAAIGLGQDAWLAFVVLCMLAPMLPLGAAVCQLLLQARGRRIGWMYGADLLGATLGALCVIPMMNWVPAPSIIAAAGMLPLLALFLVSRSDRRLVVVLSVAIVGLLAWQQPLRVEYNKSYSEQDVRPLHVRWTPTARITVFSKPIWNRDPNLPWMWGLGSRFVPEPITQMWIDQDGSAGTPIESFSGDLSSLQYLMFDVTSVGYQLMNPATACVIGVGGGRDVLTALTSGTRSVDAVELNRGIVEMLSGPVRQFSGDVYHAPGVTPVVSEGRSYLMRTAKHFDLIQVSLVDSWAATAAGAYALSENYLYTVEAFGLYWDRLSDDGVISISRFSAGMQVIESARLVLLAQESLRRIGVESPRAHIAFVEAGGVGTLLVTRKPLTATRLAELDGIVASRGFARIWPAENPDSSHHVAVVLREGSGRYDALGLDLSTPTDDRPFFFQAVSIVSGADPQLVKKLGFNERSVGVLRTLILLLCGVALLLFFSPFLLAGRLERAPGFWRGTGYFAAIGLGFMLIEVPWIQKAILYLGHPSYATAIVIGSILAGAGSGSMLAARLPLSLVLRLRWLLPVMLIATYLVSLPLLDATLLYPTPVRVAIAFLLILPSGFLLGFPFPSGMMYFGDSNKAWFWAINGAFGVVASALSLGLAMFAGFSFVIACGIVAYAVALALLAKGRGRASRGGLPSR